MIEIIVLIFLTRKIGNTASRKGLKPGTWKFLTVITWFAFEFIGALIAVLLFGYSDSTIFSIFLFAIVSAFGGYLLIKYILEKKPDQMDDEIERIGTNDLRP